MPHTSYSRLAKWFLCSFAEKLKYQDGLRLSGGNEHTAFGTAVHSTLEDLVTNKITELEIPVIFRKYFIINLRKLPQALKFSLFRNSKKIQDSDLADKAKKAQKNVKDMFAKGALLTELAFAKLNQQFPDYTLISAEEEILEEIVDFLEADWEFKGILDLVIKTPDGKYHIIDWKTTSWGWDVRKKTDQLVTNQLAYYKYFFSLVHDVDIKNIETYFGLIKRTAFEKDKKTPKKDIIEIFRVSTGAKKITNALNILQKHLYNVHHKIAVRNKLNCKFCEFYKTEHCSPGRSKKI